MKPIVQLDKSLVEKIAAGEVVDRPLSIVKELTENAIDAGATNVTVEIKDGGITQIRVTDNGCGIPLEDLPLAFARHATSKIQSFDELMEVRTLGFRGEALSSIAAVSHVEMITKTQSALAGTRVEVHGGQLKSGKEVGSVNGTTVIVSNLFYNVPARRKFLKKPGTEGGLISQFLEKFALGNPSLTLRYINNGEFVFGTTGRGDLKTVMLNIYGREVASKLISVNISADELGLVGQIGKPETARGNRSHGVFFINSRYIQNRLLTRAVESAMKGLLPQGRFPVYALNLSMPPGDLDVNVHPNKTDVRFSDEEAVYAFVEGAVRDVLGENELVPTIRIVGRVGDVGDEPEQGTLPFLRQSVASPPVSYPPRDGVVLHQPQNVFYPVHEDRSLHVAEEVSVYPVYDENEEPTIDSAPLDVEVGGGYRANYQIHGLLFSTYWLVSRDESLYLIDQHAAHERILFEELLAKARNEDVHSQRLIAPIPIHLTTREKQTLLENLDLFGKFGFEIVAENAESENEEPEIHAVPYLMKGPVSTAFFTEILDKINEVGFETDSPYAHKTEIIAMCSCKSAVKGGDMLDESEARGIIEKLMELENPFTCPHGRPTIIEITKAEIERRFKRR